MHGKIIHIFEIGSNKKGMRSILNRRMNKKVLIMMFLALLLRILFMFLDFSFDVNNHISWSQDVSFRSFVDFYELPSRESYGTIIPNYPPIAIYLFVPWYPLQQLIFNIFWNMNLNFQLFPSNLVTFVEWRGFLAGLFKIPSIFADLGIAWMVYVLAQQIVPKKKRLHLCAMGSVLFNPVFLYNSALMGQIDSIPIMFALISMYLLKYIKSPVISGVCMMIGVLIKPTAIIFLPAYIYIFLKEYNYRIFIRSLFVSVIVFISSFIPFANGKNVLLYPFVTYYQKILITQSLQSVTNGALNFWSIYYPMRSTLAEAQFLPGVSYNSFALILSVGILVFVLRKLVISKKYSWLSVYYLTTFILVMFLPKMHERYFILPLPFLILIAVKDIKYQKIFYIYSALATINIYILWTVPNIRLIHQILAWPPLQILFSCIFLVLLILSSKSQIRSSNRN
ncbi:MAG: hypothetical protein US54_C0042G0005 [Candidatus Roizmanbacteria bacterium GW2011_GWA2_37_7]|uniref:DUF2029 domain-containing protein n=1 Tax=Candidatus Roizmanbacteria bacterium GW2011_GWA2_37_7 TaxID=1618481 RepID=A0A0G0K9C2_9BACT|nr:MAG: hypothetical protein US54_C0042G0005 [Candidatus Roizmanbacteria bacterium GW2011_GWA2_37_7]